jgi:hypothetical protein
LFKVLVKRTLSPLLSSMSTLLSLEPMTTGFRTSGKHPGSEKLVHWSAWEKVIGTSDHLRGVDTASSMFKTSRRVAFWDRLVGSPPKRTFTVLSVSHPARVNRTGGNRFGNSGNRSYLSRPVPVGSQPAKFKIWIWIQKMKKSHKILKNTSRCVESNGVKNFQIFIRLV